MRRWTILAWTAFALGMIALPAASAAQEPFNPPTKAAHNSTPQHLALIREGIAFHNKGDFDAALVRYYSVLNEDPDDLLAMYESALALTGKKDYAKALEFAVRGAEYKSDRIGEFYTAIGNVYVLLKQPEVAIKAFQYGLELAPADALLHYNLSVSYAEQKRFPEALKSVKTAAVLRPDHPGSHQNLAVLFAQQGYPVPALFAAARVLTLDQQTQRSQIALAVLNSILRERPAQAGSAGAVPIPSTKKDEGDFAAQESLIAAGRPRRSLEEAQAKPEIRLLAEQMSGLFAATADQMKSAPPSSFTYQYYAPYFVEMKQRDLVEPFVYYIFQRTGMPGVAEWLKDNGERVKAFQAWSTQFQWAKQVDGVEVGARK